MWKAPSPAPGGCSQVKMKVFSGVGSGGSAQLSRLLCGSGFVWLSIQFSFKPKELFTLPRSRAVPAGILGLPGAAPLPRAGGTEAACHLQKSP